MKYITAIIVLTLSLLNIGYCEEKINISNNDHKKNIINIESKSNPLTLREIFKEIEKQTGIKTLSNSKYFSKCYNVAFDDMTVETELKNITVSEAIEKIGKIIQIKYYYLFDFSIEYNCLKIKQIDVDTEHYHVHPGVVSNVILKHIAAEKMKNIVLDNFNDIKVAIDPRINSILFLKDENSCTIKKIIEAYDNDSDTDNLRVTINTTPKGMTINQIVELMKKQVGNHITLERCVRMSTIEVQVNIANCRFEDAIDIIIKKHNINRICPQSLDREDAEMSKYLCIRKEADLYIFGY